MIYHLVHNNELIVMLMVYLLMLTSILYILRSTNIHSSAPIEKIDVLILFG
jgi:hypothetical protein